MQRPVTELVVVADSFHLKPLLRVLQSADRYQVLCVNRREIKLYEGNRYGLDEVELAAEVPRTIEEALGAELTEPHLHVSSYGAGSGAPLAPHGEPRSYHGHGGKKDELDIDTQRFFRAADRAILEHHSRPSGLPLMLAALGEYHAVFHEASQNPLLLPEGIEVNPDALPADRLREEAWRKFAPRYRERLAKLVDEFHAAKARQNASSDLAQVAGATAAGRVRTLLVEADRQIPGKLEPQSGKVSFGDLAHPRIDDLLDDLAELALRMGGEVIVAPRDAMPSTTGLAAIYRF